jgi:hypothetical protein
VKQSVSWIPYGPKWEHQEKERERALYPKKYHSSRVAERCFEVSQNVEEKWEGHDWDGWKM